MSNFNDKEQEWKRMSRRSLRATAKIRTGEIQGFTFLAALFSTILGVAWLIYVAPHIYSAASSLHSSNELLSFADSANELGQLAVGLSFMPVILVAGLLAMVVQLVIDKITQPSRDRDRSNARKREA
ncbi:hypothetical protein KF728_25805 [Candidatus Obscuribacterales bacterium]|nr:hypothetical protein [Candidatus Obscuribacterales bacterium]MBX3153595.1 hypothetical protein [Candidatus Obscuribacterales bacterium]